MTVLHSIAGKLAMREPNVGINVEYKVIYIAYHLLIQPKRISAKRNASVPQPMIIELFKQRLEGYGFDYNNMRGWQLLIDARDDYWMPHREVPQVLEFLKSIFDDGHITIFSNSIYDSKEAEGINIEFYPTNAANLYGFYDDLVDAEINWHNVNVNKHFIVLARRPTEKRVLLVKEMLDTFGDSVVASCGAIENKTRRAIIVDRPTDIVGTTQSTQPPQQQRPKVSFAELFAPYTYPLELDGIVSDKKQHSVNDIFFSAIVNVIAETMEDDHQPINISEKTFKAFAWHQIPIWHSVYGTVNEVRRMGFDMFDDIIDHSYDDEPDYGTRKEMILTQLVLFKQKFDTISSINNLRQQIMDRLEKNNKILSQIVEYERPLEVENLFKSRRKA